MRTKDKRGRIMVETSVVSFKIEERPTPGTQHIMKYQQTNVASAFIPEHKGYVNVVLNTGGFFTVTTKRRMNQFAEMFDLPFRVWQRKGVWHWDVYDDKYNAVQTGTFDESKVSFTITGLTQ